MNNKENSHSANQTVMTPKLRVTLLALLLAGSISSAAAFDLGHSRVVSAPGQPLIVQVPITNMTADEINSLSASLAPEAVWTQSGLKPPVPLATLSLDIKPGRRADSRLIELRSSEATEASIVDVLLSVSTSASSRTVQTSIIVPPPPTIRMAGDQVTVQRGDTLIGIAEQFPVQGANLYQQLWALYSSNPDAFLRENMNLLKAGAALRIPDADAVRAIDPTFAKAQYLEHVRAFRQGRGGGQGNEGLAADGRVQPLQAPPDQQQGTVEQASSEPVPPANDQVRLTAAEQDAQADAAAARAQALAEELERKQALEQNIGALQGAIDSVGQTAGSSENPNVESGKAGSAEASVSSDAGEQKADAASQSASSGSAGGSDSSDPSAQSGQAASGQTQADGVASSTSFFSRISQWVSLNTTAAIALLLAFIALILAWALRSTKQKTTAADIHEKRVEHASEEFGQKLKDIDLSLDDKPEPSLAKPDNKG